MVAFFTKLFFTMGLLLYLLMVPGVAIAIVFGAKSLADVIGVVLAVLVGFILTALYVMFIGGKLSMPLVWLSERSL